MQYIHRKRKMFKFALYLNSWLGITLMLIATGFGFFDVDFSDVDWMSLCSCSLSRSIGKSGFHRQLTSEIEVAVFDLEEKVYETEQDYMRAIEVGELVAPDCEVMLIESLPAGVYVDLYHAQQVEAHGGSQICSSNDIDLEKPEYESPPHKLFVYSNLTWTPELKNNLTGQFSYNANISIEVHARYHLARYDRGYTSVQIPPPRVFIYCNNGVNEATTCKMRGKQQQQQPSGAPSDVVRVDMATCTRDESENCMWSELHCSQLDDGMKAQSVLEFEVPVGQMEDLMLVTLGTFILTTAVAIWLAYTMLKTVMTHE